MSDVAPSIEPVPIPHLLAVKERNEHAAAAAFETPRFVGLPASALEHRASQKTPPGIERLMAARELVATEPAFPEEPIAGDTPSTESLVDPTTEATSSSRGHASEFLGRSWSNAIETTVASAASKTAVPFDDETVSSDARFSETPVASETSETKSLPLSPEELGAFELPSVLPTTFRPSVSFVAPPRLETVNPLATAGNSSVLVPTDAASLPVAELGVESLTAAVAAPGATQQSAAKSNTPTSRAAAEANFAAISGQRSRELRSSDGAPKKSFVATGDEEVKPHRKSLGIGGAKPDVTMSDRILPLPQSHPASEYAAAVAPAEMVGETGHSDSHAATVETVSSAQEAVEVVLRTVEQAASQEQKSVNLQFSIGGMDLAVRVELRADEIRTTFRTDSSELRTALSQEWQAMSGSSANGERTLRVVPAFLNASEQSALNASAGDTSSRQRQPHAQRGGDDRSISGISRARAASSAAFAPATSAVASSAASHTSRHLQTVA